MRSTRIAALLALMVAPLFAQDTTPQAAMEYLEKAAAATNAWVFQRNWDIQTACPELNAMVETALNMQIRQKLAGTPFVPPPARIQYFVLSRRDRAIGMTVKLAGVPEEMERMLEPEANRWLATSPQANMLKSLLLQPLAFPTLAQGAGLKDAQIAVHRDTAEAVDLVLTPAAGANAQIMGRPVKNVALRINKNNLTIVILQANFADDTMIQAKFDYAEVQAKDGTTFHVPSVITMKQKGVANLAPGVALPETSTMRYANHLIAAPAAGQ
jgi:hypothetical protein